MTQSIDLIDFATVTEAADYVHPIIDAAADNKIRSFVPDKSQLLARMRYDQAVAYLALPPYPTAADYPLVLLEAQKVYGDTPTDAEVSSMASALETQWAAYYGNDGILYQIEFQRARLLNFYGFSVITDVLDATSDVLYHISIIA